MKTGYVYASQYLEHDTGNHVENSRRLSAVTAELERSGLAEKLVHIEPRDASFAEIASVHNPDYISRIQKQASCGGGCMDADTVLSTKSFDVAVKAAGGLLTAVEAILNGDVTNALALVRPPGHHARPGRAMGFCIFNNVAIAARYLIDRIALKRIAIIDFDVHHGNGTQEVFYDNPRILYFSTHQYPLYPGTGHYEEIGEGEGVGFTVNVPLPAGSGDMEYIAVYQDILVPVLNRFRPEFILVSSGYDAHWADTIASMQTTVTGIAEVVKVIRESAEHLCSGRLALCLEGGYNLEALAYSVRATLEILRGGEDIVDPIGPTSKSASSFGLSNYLERLRKIHHL